MGVKLILTAWSASDIERLTYAIAGSKGILMATNEKYRLFA